MPRVVISDVDAGHAATIKAAILVGYGSDISVDITTRVSFGFNSDADYAALVGAVALLRSTVGLTSFINKAQQVYDANGIQSFVPLGSNSDVELSQPSSIPVIVTSGAGDTENDTAYGPGLEFWDDDNDGNPAGDTSSYSNGTVLGKLLKIKDQRAGSWWNARYAARQTASNNGVWDKFNGYGKINVAAAIAFAGSVPADPYSGLPAGGGSGTVTTWTTSTRTVSNATMTTPFAATDVGKGVGFVIGLEAYYGRIASVVSGTSVILHAGANLPTLNGTISMLILFDLGETHAYSDYLTEIDSKIQDDVPKLSDDDKKAALRGAVTDYGHDRAISVKVAVAGTGTDEYLLKNILGGLWVYGFTDVREVEYPRGNKPRTILEREDWEILDDGSAQDGSNIKLRFLSGSPGVSEYFVLDVALEPRLPEVGVANFPDTEENFNNITTLAAAYCCQRLAAAYAPSSDGTISADVVNYHEKTRKYTDLARNYLKRYYRNVFGSEDPPSGVRAAFVDIDLDADTSQGQDFLFHSRRFR